MPRKTHTPTQVELREIRPEGLELSLDLGGEFARQALEGTEADPNQANVKAEVFLSRSGQDVYVKGKLVGALTVPCGRCVTPAELPLDAPFELTLAPAPEAVEPDELELTDEDLDFATYKDDVIDLGEILREQILLALPIAHLCRPECKGLCPKCGHDLNTGPCDCPPAPRDDRFAALRNVKL